ncbi:unnamed protein product [Rhizoctonia solani]|uniref:Protein kinase domain-containing protein n=1 Tax=Rhizoctonia solani TaxID=456999 RepID=A0A8H3H111_9AGAM|nr:unnamed protein product [Rhizoctonia solani]
MAYPTEPTQSRRSSIVHEGHTRGVTSVAFSPDGKSVASGSFDNTIRMWDALSPSQIGEPLTGHHDKIWSISYSALGNVIASGSWDKTIRLWDVNTHRQMEGHTEGVLSVAFSPDGKSLVSGSYDQTIRMWDAFSPSPIGEPLRGHSTYVYSISYSPLGNIIASGSNDKTIRLWDVNTGRQLDEPLRGSYTFLSVAFSPDAKLIASDYGPGGRTIQLWDVEKRKLASDPFKGHTQVVRSVGFSPDGTRVVSGSNDETIRVWDVERGTTIVGPLKRHLNLVSSVAFSPDGSQILSCSFDFTLRLWDTRSGRTIGNPYQGHTGNVHSVAFSPCGTYVTSGGQDKTVRLWDMRTGRQLDQPFDEHSDWVYSVAFSPCGHYIASGSDDRKVIIRSIFVTYPEPPSNFEPCVTPEDGDNPLPNEAPQIVVSQMSTQEISRDKAAFLALTTSQCIDVASGLEYMHAQGTVHGDLKALNVLVSLEGVARISDFDFSVMSSASGLMFSASSNSRAGSIRWVAPEMLKEDEEAPQRTKQSDVYALGMTMLEIFTGKVPYSQFQNDFSIMMTVKRGTLPARPIEQLKNDAQGNFVWELLLRCWSRNLMERPSAGEVVSTLVSRTGGA